MVVRNFSIVRGLFPDDLAMYLIFKHHPISVQVTWRNVQFRADSVRCSPCGRIFWRRHRTAVFALKNFNNVDSWFEVAQGVREFDVNDWSGIVLKEVKQIKRTLVFLMLVKTVFPLSGRRDRDAEGPWAGPPLL